MASPTVDSSQAGYTGAGTNTVSGSFSTIANNTVVLVGVHIEDPSSSVTVSSITATGLTFVKVGAIAGTITSQFAGNSNYNLELWATPVATAQAISFTATLSSASNGCHVTFVSVKSLYDITSWWDDDPSIYPTPATGLTASSGGASVTFSTQEADDLIILWSGTDGGSGLTGPGGSWSAIQSTLGGGGSGGHGCLVRIDSLTVSATQTSVTVSNHNSSGGGTVALLVALTADAKGFKLQTFVSFCSSG